MTVPRVAVLAAVLGIAVGMSATGLGAQGALVRRPFTRKIDSTTAPKSVQKPDAAAIAKWLEGLSPDSASTIQKAIAAATSPDTKALLYNQLKTDLQQVKLSDADVDEVLKQVASKAGDTPPTPPNPFTSLVDLIVNDGRWCNPGTDSLRLVAAPHIQFCHLFITSGAAGKAAQTFWDNQKTSPGDVTFTRVLNLIGNGKTQSARLELLSDFWGATRVSFSGVLNTDPSDTTKTAPSQSTRVNNAVGSRSFALRTPRFTSRPDTGKAAAPASGSNAATTAAQSQAQQFLNNGGPASLRLDRPFFVANIGPLSSIIMGHQTASFSAPGAGKGDAPADSMQFAQTGVDVQTQIDGINGKLGGIINVHFDRVYGTRKFYHTATGDTTMNHAFGAASFSGGLLLENSVQLTWNRVFFGPSKLQSGANYFTVNITR